MGRIGRWSAIVMAVAVSTASAASVGAQTGAAPFGVIDRIDLAGPSTAIVHGWALDRDAAGSSPVHVYVDGRLHAAGVADHPRPDVAAAHGADRIDLGYAIALDGLTPGLHEVCAWAIDGPETGPNPRLGCATVDTRGRPPIGVIDVVAPAGPGRVTAEGWVVDPDTDDPTDVHVYVDGRLAGAGRADQARPDVAAALGVGPAHGFSVTIEGLAFGTHQICVYGIDRPAPTANPRLGCARRNVDAPVPGPRGELVVNGVGDVRADPHWYGSAADPDYSRVLAGLDGLFLEDDLTVINLECAGSRLGRPVPKNFNFRCDPDSFAHFRAAGVDVTSQANNHGLDYGVEAMLDASERLWAAGLAEVGSGASQTDALEPALFAIDGWRVAVLGLAGFVEFPWQIAGPTSPGLADGYDLATMADAVRRADAIADIVVVTIHWGREGVTTPVQSQVDRGHALVDAGADIVFGHHPHRLQPVERYRDGVIFYSLGNFQWPRLSAASADTAVGQVIVTPDGALHPCLLDATIVAHGRTTLDDPSRRRC